MLTLLEALSFTFLAQRLIALKVGEVALKISVVTFLRQSGYNRRSVYFTAYAVLFRNGKSKTKNCLKLWFSKVGLGFQWVATRCLKKHAGKIPEVLIGHSFYFTSFYCETG